MRILGIGTFVVGLEGFHAELFLIVLIGGFSHEGGGGRIVDVIG